MLVVKAASGNRTAATGVAGGGGDAVCGGGISAGVLPQATTIVLQSPFCGGGTRMRAHHGKANGRRAHGVRAVDRS